MSAARSTHAPCWSVADPGTEPVTVQYAAIAYGPYVVQELKSYQCGLMKGAEL
jgi:hypothetical protein